MWLGTERWVFHTDFGDVRLLRPQDPDWQSGFRHLTDLCFARDFVIQLLRADETQAWKRFVELLAEAGAHHSACTREEVINAVAQLLVRDQIRFLGEEKPSLSSSISVASLQMAESIDSDDGREAIAESGDVQESSESSLQHTALAIEVLKPDGAPVEAVDVCIDGTLAGTTSTSGTWASKDVAAGTYRVEARCEGYRGEQQVTVAEGATERARVTLTKLQAELHWPATDTTHKQYVNLDADSDHPEQSSQIGIKVKIKEGKSGDKVFLKLEYDAQQVSKRNDPERTVVGGIVDASWCPQGGKEVVLTADEQEVTIPIELGCAGGDEYLVHVGATKACDDAKCTIVNWRRLWYEVMAPNFMEVVSASGFVPATRARIDELLHPCFIEYKAHKVHIFDEAAAPRGSLYGTSYFNTKRKQLALTTFDYFMPPTRNKMTWDGGKQPRSVHLRLCDRAFMGGGGTYRMAQRCTQKIVRFRTGGGLGGEQMLPVDPEDGRTSIRGFYWVAMVSLSENPTHPGVMHRSVATLRQRRLAYSLGLFSGENAPRCGLLDPRSDVRFLSAEEIEVTLPDGSADAPGPGRLVHSEITAQQCPVKVVLEYQSSLPIHGMTSGKKGESLNVIACDMEPRFVGDVIVHELCHRAGMAVIGKNRPSPGLPWPKNTDELDPDNEDPDSTLGHLYEGSGHFGAHCARGLTDDEKRQASYARFVGTCVNFGAGVSDNPRCGSSGICPTCAQVLKARRLDQI